MPIVSDLATAPALWGPRPGASARQTTNRSILQVKINVEAGLAEGLDQPQI
jgi:hypothetical protein